MRILSKHQKKGEDGFIDYVAFLESIAPQKAKEIISVGVLEDPVYMKWIMANMITFDYFMTLGDDDIEIISKTLNSPVKTYLYAFYNTRYEDSFLKDKLSEQLVREYKDEREYVGEIKKGEQETAQRTILETVRKLQKERNITKFEWQLPNDAILNGKNYVIDKDNDYELDYDDGTPALRGSVESKLRSGEWEHYYPNGCLMAKGNYVDDEREGMWVFYYSNGKMKATGTFTESMKQGEWSEYDLEGNATSVNYERGRKVD